MKSLLSHSLLLTFIKCYHVRSLQRAEKKYNTDKLRKFHRLNGKLYFILYVLIAYLCLNFIYRTETELSPRATFHGVFALSVLVLLLLKVSFVRIYRQFYGYVKTIGILIALLTFGMIGTSAGYYLLITNFGTDILFKKAVEEKRGLAKEAMIIVKTDMESIKKGRELYDSKCSFCHNPYGTEKIVGPGHKGILKNPFLPASKKPSTPENIANQIRNPYRDMPSFSYLSNEQISDIIAFLNTL
jgi:hypothetical protein